MAGDEAARASESELPKEGDILAGKYRIDRVLGQGGMGVVVAAHHTTLRQNVAVKFLLPEAAKRTESCERFLREARAAVSIQSEHVARVTDVGTLETGAPYMVMEFLTGSDLGDVIDDRGPLPVEEAVDYVLQACEAIAEAHAMGLIHRDLKPANLFLTTRADGSPLVKVLDFGLSKATKPDAMDASLTAAHVLMGSPFYMAPEQIRSFKTIDARADIWAIGVILYQLLTGDCPFQAESLGALFMAIGSDPVPPIRDRRPEVPEALDEAIARCLVKDPKGRTQTISELARALAPFGAVNSHISVERIARVMSDDTPIAQTPSRAPAENKAQATPKPGVDAQSGAMSAMSVSEGSAREGSAPGGPSAPAANARRLGVMAGVVVLTAAATLAAVRVLGSTRVDTQSAAPLATESAKGTAAMTAAPPAPAFSAAPTVTPAPEPIVSAAAPTASASSAPVTSAKAARPGAPGAKSTAAPKGSSAPKLSNPVSAALKHDEKFD